MKILIVTGRLAFDKVREAVFGLADVDVLELPTAVASLITPQKLMTGFSSSSFSKNKYDAFLVSGFSRFDFSRAEAEIGCPVYLGPKHAADLKHVLSSGSFSKTIPACELIHMEKAEKVKETLAAAALKEKPAFNIGIRLNAPDYFKTVSIGGRSGMKVLAEIVRAGSLTFSELEAEVNYLIREGADMIDLGFSPDADEKMISDTVSFVKSVSSVPVSVDAGEFQQLFAGISAGADLVLSLDGNSLFEFGNLFSSPSFSKLSEPPAFLKNTAVVVIPDLFSEKNKIESLEANIASAQTLGFQKIIADLVLSPPDSGMVSSTTSSIVDYFSFHQRNPDIPILFGAGNVTELYDADSVGMNALLAALADECGASILFTPNASDKGKGSVRELRTAADMMLLSNILRSSPKDLGIDLLVLKEKRKRPDFNLSMISKSGAFDYLHLRNEDIEKNIEKKSAPANSSVAPVKAPGFILSGQLNPAFTPDTKWGWKADKAGNFIIGVTSVSGLLDFFEGRLNGDEIEKLKMIDTPGQRVIVAVHPKTIIVGTDSAFMLETALNNGLISELSHAGYLGRELQKAEIALLFGRSYSQDDIF